MYLWIQIECICGPWLNSFVDRALKVLRVMYIVHPGPRRVRAPSLPPSRATRGWAAHCPSSTPPPPPPRLLLLLHSSSSSRVKPTGRWPPRAKTSRTTTRVLLLQADNLSPATSWICCDLRKVYFSLKWIVFVPLIATICEVQCLIVWSRRMVCCRELQPAHQCTPLRVQTHKSSFTFSNMDLISNCDKLASFKRCIDLLMSKLWQLWRRAVMRVVGVNPEWEGFAYSEKSVFLSEMTLYSWMRVAGLGELRCSSWWRSWQQQCWWWCCPTSPKAKWNFDPNNASEAPKQQAKTRSREGFHEETCVCCVRFFFLVIFTRAQCEISGTLQVFKEQFHLIKTKLFSLVKKTITLRITSVIYRIEEAFSPMTIQQICNPRFFWKAFSLSFWTKLDPGTGWKPQRGENVRCWWITPYICKSLRHTFPIAIIIIATFSRTKILKIWWEWWWEWWWWWWWWWWF